MSMDLVLLGWILLLMNPSVFELLVWIVVLGFLCPNLLRIIRIYAASMMEIYRAPSLASAADDMAFLMMWVMLRMAPLLWDTVV